MSATDTLPYVEAELRYTAPTEERPVFYYHECDHPAQPLAVPHRVRIHDMRSIAGDISLDRHGFALIQHRTQIDDLWDEDAVRNLYYPEAARVVAEVTGARRAYAFDHVLRTPDPSHDPGGYIDTPLRLVHIDHSDRSVGSGFLWRSMRLTRMQRFRNLLGDEADELLRGRIEVIHMWRPVRGPVLDTHLALCDHATVDANDLVPSDFEYGDRVSQGYAVKHNAAHVWYYAPKMTRDEAFLIKCSDTKAGDCAQFAPHAAFNDPAAPVDAPHRWSIEVRMLVFHGT